MTLHAKTCCYQLSGVGRLGRLLSLASLGSAGCGSVRLSALVVLCRWSRLALVFLAMPRLVSLSPFITRVAPHRVNTLRILHAAYDD